MYKKNPEIYAKIATSFTRGGDIIPLLSKYSKELAFDNFLSDFFPLTASSEFPNCPILAHLTIRKHHIDESVPLRLRGALHDGKLPNLRLITLDECCGKSSHSDWPVEVQVEIFPYISYSCAKCQI